MKNATAANSEAGKSSPAAAANFAETGHMQTPQEMAAEVQAGQASKCAVITDPTGAEIDIDGNKAGLSPMVFVLLRKGVTPRVITIKMNGYKTIVKSVVPDGKIIPLGLTLEKESQ
jgi:CRISPR/Cas system-associated exonuclease Cas4 (RecB family)